MRMALGIVRIKLLGQKAFENTYSQKERLHESDNWI